MAAKSYLSREQFEQASSIIKAPPHAPTGDESEASELYSLEFSKWLALKLHQRLSAHPDWEAARPVALGSWARGELCPRSDVDLLFCGSEDAVRRLVDDFSKQGVKLRYRMPEDPLDWTKGVLPFDVLALFAAMPMTSASEAELSLQKSALNSQTFRKSLLRAMTIERKSRMERYDSIANFLEPNLKFGPGALRDLEQALVTIELFPDKYSRVSLESRHAKAVLLYYKRFFLLVRQRLHLSDGGGDVLAAPEQRSISEWLGYKDSKDFMREIQKGLARVSFYADWVIAVAAASGARIASINKKSLHTVRQLFEALESDSSVLMQSRVRNASDAVFSKQKSSDIQTQRSFNSKETIRENSANDRLVGKKLGELIRPGGDESALVALIRSRLIDHCVPDFRRIVGQVQHDQYHRFSVDAHITQALRELSRMRCRPALAGRLKALVKSLSEQDWQILAFSSLYHDIAKGRDGDHAQLGIAIVQSDLARFGKSHAFTGEVAWIVEQHLILSSAAFRENSRSPQTWQKLAEKGAVGRRLTRLAVFTMVDIRATNPDAWTPWKERLLAELIEQLTLPEASQFLDFSTRIKKEFFLMAGPGGRDLAGRLSETLDPFLISSLPRAALIGDLKSAYQASVVSQKVHKQTIPNTPRPAEFQQRPPLIIRVRSGAQTWIRFHSPMDRAGLFLEYVTQLTSSGLSIRHASIQTSDDLGVYDWFEVKTKRSVADVRRLLVASSKVKPALRAANHSRVRFDSIELVSTSHQDWVISFRGKDQAGALSEAVRVLFEEGLAIHWAKVHTWGRQIDDVFSVTRDERAVGDLLKKLHSELAFSEEKFRLGIVDKKVKL